MIEQILLIMIAQIADIINKLKRREMHHFADYA